MKTTRRNFIKLALAGILALFTARFSKPSAVETASGDLVGGDVLPEKRDWDGLEDWGGVYPAGTVCVASVDINGKHTELSTRNGIIWYISKDGDDANSGKSPDDAFLTSGAALRAATRNFSSLPHCPIIFELRSKCQ